MRIATEHGLSFWLAGGRVLHGWSLAAMRDTEAGIRQLRQGVIAWQATGSATYRTYYLALLAEALASSGNVSTAQGLLDEALALADRTDERFFEPELHRLSGDLHTKRSGAPGLTSIAMAEAAYRRALDLSSRQDAKSLQLRALMSLARLDMSRANSDVHRHLTETLAAFSQGLDTPDLQEASALVKSWTHE
jgi:adenylate cyclase